MLINSILKFTEGNLSVAILAWLALGLTLVFAGIAMSVLASRSEREGGIVGYMEDLYGEKAAFLTGWFTTFIYIPLLTGILAIVAAIYGLELVGLQVNAFNMQVAAAIFIAITYTWNYVSTKFAALFSSTATVIKLLPIIVVGFVGLSKFDAELAVGGFASFNMGLFAAPLLSMAFAFDGWTSVATLSRDMENPQKDIAKAKELLSFVGLANFEQAYIRNLSGGQKQRVAIARTLMTNPKLILCDEPTSALDEKMSYEILKLLEDINERFEATIVLVSHNISVIKAICNRVAIIDNGRISDIITLETKRKQCRRFLSLRTGESRETIPNRRAGCPSRGGI